MRRLHPYVNCPECHSTGRVLVDVDPDVGPINDPCPVCGEERYRQSGEILADAKSNYIIHAPAFVDGTERAAVSYAGALLGSVVRKDGRWTGEIRFAGGTVPASIMVPRFVDDSGAYHADWYRDWADVDEAAKAVVQTAAGHGIIG